MSGCCCRSPRAESLLCRDRNRDDNASIQRARNYPCNSLCKHRRHSIAQLAILRAPGPGQLVVWRESLDRHALINGQPPQPRRGIAGSGRTTCHQMPMIGLNVAFRAIEDFRLINDWRFVSAHRSGESCCPFLRWQRTTGAVEHHARIGRLSHDRGSGKRDLGCAGP